MAQAPVHPNPFVPNNGAGNGPGRGGTFGKFLFRRPEIGPACRAVTPRAPEGHRVGEARIIGSLKTPSREKTKNWQKEQNQSNPRPSGPHPTGRASGLDALPVRAPDRKSVV